MKLTVDKKFKQHGDTISELVSAVVAMTSNITSFQQEFDKNETEVGKRCINFIYETEKCKN